jgi:Flp pilus assembly protein TadG
MMRITVKRPQHRLNSRDQGRHQSGQAVVELALVLPILAFLIFAIIDSSMLFYAYHSMEQGISEATRYGLTGQRSEDPNNPGNYLSRQDSMKLIMRKYTPNIVLSDSNFAFEHLNGSVWASGTGAADEISRMIVSYNWRPITPLVSRFLTGGQIPLRVSSTVKNESFPNP